MPDAEQSVAFADALQRTASRTTLADAWHQSGARADALVLFREAEAMQAQLQPESPLLYSLQGFPYRDLLLGEAERIAWATILASNPAATETPKLKLQLDTLCEVAQRAAQAFIIADDYNWLLDIALDRLTLGRMAVYRAILERSSSFAPAGDSLTAAVDGLRAAGAMDHLPRGFLTRTWLRIMEGDPAGAQADLDKAWQIAERGTMRLHLADIHLHRARLFCEKPALAEARKLIERCGYGRRKEELEDAEEAAKNWPEPQPTNMFPPIPVEPQQPPTPSPAHEIARRLAQSHR